MDLKKILIYFFTSIFVVLVFLNITFNRSKIVYEIIKFKQSTKIFIDREYIDINYSEFLNDTILIQAARHNYKKILVYSNSPVIIYRPSCPLNINDHYRANWEIFKNKVKIKGFSCEHSKTYFRSFKGPLILLEPGGPIASDPIFIKSKNKKIKIIVLNKLVD